MFDQRSLNAAADSNHVCDIMGDDIEIDNPNCCSMPNMNRDNKIYKVLCSCHEECSNVHLLDQEKGEDESMKLVPKVLEIPACIKELGGWRYPTVPLSIMYEFLRNSKMPSLYYEAHPQLT